MCKYSKSAKNMYIQTIDNKNKRLKVEKISLKAYKATGIRTLKYLKIPKK